MSAYFNGKNVNLNYVFNNNAYTNTVTGDAKAVLEDITEGQDITVTVLMGDNVIPNTELHVYGTNPSEYISYVTDDNGRAVVKGIAPITTIDAISEEYTVKAEYTKSIPEAFDSIKKDINANIKADVDAIKSRVDAIDNNVVDVKKRLNDFHNFAGALKGKASGKSAVALKYVSEIEHDVKVELSSNDISLTDTKIQVFGDNLFNTEIFQAIRSEWIDKGVLQANVLGDNCCTISLYENPSMQDKKTEFINMLEALNGQTLTFSVDSVIPSDLRMVFAIRYEDNSAHEYHGANGSNVLSFTLNLSENKKLSRVYFRPLYKNVGFTDTTTVLRGFKLEIGKKTPYHPYIEPLLYDATKTIIPSSYPAMTLICKGVNLKAEYNKDITGVVESQQREIDALKTMILEIITK